METQFNTKDKNKIQKAIRKKYKKVAKSPDGLFKYPTGKSGLETLQYESDIIKKLPKNVMESYCGVGNPFSLGPICKGEAVLDVGCGAGVDTIIAAMMTTPIGKPSELMSFLICWKRLKIIFQCGKGFPGNASNCRIFKRRTGQRNRF